MIRKRNFLIIEPLCFHCEASIDAALMVEDFFEEGIEIIDASSEEFPEELVKMPLEHKEKGKILTPTFIKIRDDSMVKLMATELFFGDLGLLEGLFKDELPSDIPVGKHVPWIE